MSTEPARTDTSTDNATTDNATTDNAVNDTSESLPILRSNESASSLEDVIIASDFRSAVASSQQKPAIVAVPVAVVPAVVPAAVPTVVPAVVPVPVPAPSAVLSLPECLYGVAYHLANPHGNVATGNNGDCTDTIDPQQMPIVSPSLQLLGEHEHEISLTALRKIAATGIPDDDAEGSCRAVTWRVLLGYLPVHTNQWSATLEHQRSLYSSFVHDLFGPVSDVTVTAHELRGKRRHWSTHGTRPDSNLAESQDHSSSSASSVEAQVQPVVAAQPPMQPQELPAAVKDYWKSKGKDLHVLENLTRNMNALHLQEAATVAEAPQEPWQDFCESAVLLDEIRKDVVRTHPDLSFYLEPDKGSRRYAALERILFVWSKFNRGVRYVQGMNEIVGTLYYVLSNDWNDEWADHAEADTYWLLNTLLSDMRDVFVPDLDDAETGIQGRIAHMHTLLGRHDPEVKEHLEDCGIDASFYAIRWWTTLLSREFLLPDTIRLWDSMMGSTHKDNFLRYVCVTMVILVRDALLKGDFAVCLRILQNYPSIHMDHMLESSRALWIYESQITLACHKGGISLHQALQTITPPPAVIMAFGFRDGAISLSPSEQIEEAGEKMAASVKVATTAMATSAREAKSAMTNSAQGLFGRASRFYSKYKNRSHSDLTGDSGGESSDGLFHSQSLDSALEAVPKKEASDADKLYLDAILNA